MTSDVFKHGRSAYAYHGCRCETCRTANSRYIRARRLYMPLNADHIEPAPPKPAQEPVVRWIPLGGWADAAACRTRNVHEIPQSYIRHALRWGGLDHARAACEACPVLDECRAWVLAHRVDPCLAHVVAAMTPTERNRERRARGIKVPGAPGKGEAA